MGKGYLRRKQRFESSDSSNPKRIKKDRVPAESLFQDEASYADSDDNLEPCHNYNRLLVVTFCLEIWEKSNHNPLLLLKVDTWIELLTKYNASKCANHSTNSMISFHRQLKSVCNLFMSQEFFPAVLNAFTTSGIPSEQIDDFMRAVDEMRASDQLDITRTYLENWGKEDSVEESMDLCNDSETVSVSSSNSITKSLSQIEIDETKSKMIRDELSTSRRCIVLIEELKVEEVGVSPGTSRIGNTERHSKLIRTKSEIPTPTPAFSNVSSSDDSSDSLGLPCITSFDNCKETTPKPSLGNTFRPPTRRDLSRDLRRLGDVQMVLPSRRSTYRDVSKQYLPCGPTNSYPLKREMLEVVIKHTKTDSESEKSESDTVVIKKFDLTVKRNDLLTFGRSFWLEDPAINFYLEMIRERNNTPGSGFPQIVIYHSHIYGLWAKNKTFDVIKDHADGIDIFKFDLAFLPVHADSHWKMLVADFRKKTICCYDSIFGNENMVFVKDFRDILKEEWAQRIGDGEERKVRKKNAAAYMRTWKVMEKPELAIPAQDNGNDCGVFALLYADYLARNKKFDFSQQHIPYFRHLMGYQTVLGTLTVPSN